ncbi:MAG: DinB family protein [Candidatus Doudnabacteria bacterium]|nr:DinB family protein [Candidatus Doudnabacteria bacterium]
MSNNMKCEALLAELEMEANATRKCLERIPETTFEWKPHEKSMKMGSLAVIVADIPRWIVKTVKDSVIDFGTYEHWYPKNTEELVTHFDQSINEAKETLKNTNDEELDKVFELRNNGQVLYSSPKGASVGSSINHWVHHRGQMTVYMRMNNIPVPSIYGPSADDQTF